MHAFIVNGQKGKYCVTCTFPKGDFSAFPKNHVGFAPKNIKINTHKIEIDCECGKPNAIENMIGCEGINKLLIKLPDLLTYLLGVFRSMAFHCKILNMP